MNTSDPIRIDHLDHGLCRDWPFSQDVCAACAACAGACPAAGIDGFDPRLLIRQISLGQIRDVVNARWPWICTMCGKCEAICPMGIEIPDLVRRIRSLRPRDEVPGILHKGIVAALETGNNLRMPTEDYLFVIQDVAEEIAEEPGYEDFSVVPDKKGAAILTTIHNKLVNTHTEDLKHWWKIFHAAGENWTLPSVNWEGTSWGYFTGDDEAVRTMAGRIVEQMERLKVTGLLWPE